jgi:Toastrack DUF4097
MNYRINSRGLARVAVAASVLATLALLVPSAGRAQAPATKLECEHNGSDGNGRRSGLFGWFRRGNRFETCEIREQTIAASGKLVVDASPNGGVRVTGWDRDDVLVRAAVRVWGGDEGEARELASQIEIQTEDGRIRADGPGQSWNRMAWTVSYEVFAPRATDLDLETVNGGVVLTDVDGEIDFDTTNGGVSLNGVAGDVRGRTTNGGIDVRLTGDSWRGDGLDLATTNGGVRLRVPEDYSARLEARTTNGGIDTDFPVAVEGRLSRRNLSATLGQGGALVSVRTTNGGVHVMRD